MKQCRIVQNTGGKYSHNKDMEDFPNDNLWDPLGTFTLVMVGGLPQNNSKRKQDNKNPINY